VGGSQYQIASWITCRDGRYKKNVPVPGTFNFYEKGKKNNIKSPLKDCFRKKISEKSCLIHPDIKVKLGLPGGFIYPVQGIFIPISSLFIHNL